MQTRSPWQQYFLELAASVATRATCDRRKVGCVITTTDHRILATGYNGSLRGTPHCDDVGHRMIDGHCCRTVHAEANAVCSAAANGVALRGAVAYVTHAPCRHCFQLLTSAGISAIVFAEAYRSEALAELAAEARIPVIGPDGPITGR